MAENKTKYVPREELARQAQFESQVRQFLAQRYQTPPLAAVHTFGCQQNVADSERMKGMLEAMGYGFTEQAEQAQLILFNTCAVREHAEQRVFGNVGALKAYKKEHPDAVIALCGCMMQQKHIAEKIKKSYPFVDLVFGTHVVHRLPELLYKTLTGGKRVFSLPDMDGVIAEGVPVRRDDPYKAWLPIMYGCNNFCSYCIVPYVRGRERSRQMEQVVAEARELLSQGVREITLLGQNVNSYGKDLSPRVSFSRLLRELDGLEGEFRIRFMTSHPKDCTRELLDAMAECPKVAKHLHLPFQSGNNRVLRAMNRGYTRERYLELIRYARQRMPDLAITSDVIVGFPGETYEEFLDTLSLVQETEFSALFTFIYSPREGTPAAQLPDPVSRKEKGEWFTQLTRAQEAVSETVMNRFQNQVETVFVTGAAKGAGMLSGRTDGNILVEFPGPEEWIGSFRPVKITQPKAYLLLGEPLSINLRTNS